jgi:hypothetical protein
MWLWHDLLAAAEGMAGSGSVGDASQDALELPSARSGDIFGNGQVLVVRTSEGRADSISANSWASSNPSGSTTLRLLWIHLGSIALSHGLFLGNTDR